MMLAAGAGFTGNYPADCYQKLHLAPVSGAAPTTDGVARTFVWPVNCNSNRRAFLRRHALSFWTCLQTLNTSLIDPSEFKITFTGIPQTLHAAIADFSSDFTSASTSRVSLD